MSIEEKNSKGRAGVDWKTLSGTDAEQKVELLRNELFMLRLNVRFKHNPSFSSDQRLLKKEIARGLTYLNSMNNTSKDAR